MTNYITAAGVQQFSITIASGSTTGTVNLGTAVGAGAFINYGGSNPSATSNFAEAGAYLSWATAGGTTTITATRNTGTAGTVVVTGSITDGDTTNLVVAVQQGTVSISSGTSGTASVTAPGSDANTILHYLGNTSTSGSLVFDEEYTTITQSGATVTARVPLTGGATVTGFELIELQSSCLTANAVQRISATSSNSVTSWTASLAHNVVLANTLSFWAGRSIASVSTTDTEALMYGALTGVGTFTANVNTAAAFAKTYNASLPEFNSGVLNSAVQRGTTTLTGVLSNTSSLTSINESYAGVSWLGNTTTAGANLLNESTGAVALGFGAPYLQVNGNSSAASAFGGSLTITLSSVTAGSAIIVAFGSGGGTGTAPASSVSDSASQSYTNVSAANVSHVVGAGTYNTSIWYFQNTTAGVTSVTINYSGTSNSATVYGMVYEVAAPTSGSLVDATATATSSPSGGVTTTAAHDFIIQAIVPPVSSVSSPYTLDSIEKIAAYYQPPTTVSGSTMTATGADAISTVAFLANANTNDLVTVTKATAAANITGSWEAFEFPAPSSGTTSTFASTAIADGMAASGALGFSGSFAKTAIADFMAATGIIPIPVTSAFASTAKADALAATGKETFAGALSVTGLLDALSGTGLETFKGALSTTAIADLMAAAGAEQFKSVLATTQAAMVMASVGAETFTAALAVAAKLDTMISAGELEYTGAVSATAIKDAMNAMASTGFGFISAFAVTAQPDAMVASGNVPILNNIVEWIIRARRRGVR